MKNKDKEIDGILTLTQMQEVVRHSVVSHYQGMFKTWDDPENVFFNFTGTFEELSQMFKDISVWYKRHGITWNMINSLDISAPEKIYLYAFTSRNSKVGRLLEDGAVEPLFAQEHMFKVIGRFIGDEFINYCLASKSIALNKFAAFWDQSAATVLLLDKKKSLRNFAETRLK